MDSLRLSPLHSFVIPSKLYSKTHFTKPISLNAANNNNNPTTLRRTTLSSRQQRNGKSFKLFTTMSPFVSDTDTETETETPDGKFDWYAEWYPVMPVCDLDKRVPHGKKVMGMDVVVWWDRNESAWKVFDDRCPHRLAPLSEGRIDQWGRLQCVYHGWCFNGGGVCKLVPQAPPDGPPVHTFKKACATVYPSTVQNNIVWFWPNADPQYKDIITKKKPPYISEIDDPSFSTLMGNRDFPYGYEVMVENLMDPAHIQYAHYGIMQAPKPKNPVDREGGRPLDLAVTSLDPGGFIAKLATGATRFFAPLVVYVSISIKMNKDSAAEKRNSLVFMCIPVSPGKSRLIWAFPRNFMTWIDKVIPRWIIHIGQNLILDSDLYLLHLEERKIMEAGGSAKWQKACFVPTKSDAFVVGFRKWLNKYAGGQVDWRGKFNTALPPTPPREQLMDRYWTHVVNCRSCSGAHKALKVLEVALQVVSISVLGIVAATKQAIPSMAVKTAMVSMAVLCFAASKWLAYFVHKIFHFHDYNHAFR